MIGAACHSIDDLAHRLGAYRPPEPELAEIKRDVHPAKLVEEIERVEEQVQNTTVDE